MNSNENEFVRHEPCPECTSSDAFAIYSDGGGYCFSCGFHQKGSSDTNLQPTKVRRMVNYTGDFARLAKRRITEKTCRKFNVRQEGPALRFPYYSDGQIVAYKERDPSKNFSWVGKNEGHQLFGQHLFGSGKTIVVVEGEIDALAYFECRDSWPVVSLPNGAQGARKALQYQLKYLLNFEEIILSFDQDEAGQKAVQDCIDLFPPERVFVGIVGGYKDASEALMAGDSEAIRQSIYKKRPYVPTSLVDGRDLFDLVSSPLRGRDCDYPYAGLNDLCGGLRRSELVTICSGSGCGKSTLCGEIAVSLINQGEKVGYIALEESVKRTGLRLMTVAANKPLHLNNEIPKEDFKSAFRDTLGSGHVFLRDGFGSCDPDVLLNDIRYLVKTNGVNWIILDHLSILISGNENMDERKTLDLVMTKLRSFCEECNVGMILISHLRRAQGDKGPEDGTQISLQMLRGSHSIVQLSDFCIALQRNISAGDNRADLVVLKNRHTGRTGPCGQLMYHQETGRLQEALDFSDDSTQPTDYTDF